MNATTTRNLIEQALEVEKAAAQDRAEQVARQRIAQVEADLTAAGWDRAAVAPRPNGNMTRAAYRQAEARCQLVYGLTVSTDSTYKFRGPDLGKMSPEGAAFFVSQARENAASEHESFAAKLASKVGEVTAASLVGSHVWGFSVLTVTKADGTVERWQTQMIINVSVHGKLFNQFPTRKVK